MGELTGRNEQVKMTRIPSTKNRHTGEVIEPPPPDEGPEGGLERGDSVTLKSAQNDDTAKEKFNIVDITDFGEHADERYRYHLRSEGPNPRNVVAYPNEIEKADN